MIQVPRLCYLIPCPSHPALKPRKLRSSPLTEQQHKVIVGSASLLKLALPHHRPEPIPITPL
jgi:hypothetical protein